MILYHPDTSASKKNGQRKNNFIAGIFRENKKK
jgi:hypothetical protein